MILMVLACTRGDSLDATGPTAALGSPLSFEDDRVPRNLLVVTYDTTRRDTVGYYSGLSTTPFLDARLNEGVVLTDHRTCSNWTAPSMLCATTGRDPRELGFWPGSGDPEVGGTPEGLETLAATLTAGGWATSLVTGNVVFSADFGPGQGFATEVVRDYEPGEVVRADAEDALDVLLAGPAPWFLHVHFMDPHREYCPPLPYRAGLAAVPEIGFDLCDDLPGALAAREDHDAAWAESLLEGAKVLYRGELAYLDDTLAAFWEAAEGRGALDDALVVWFTDHGEQQLEHGVIDHGFRLNAEENRAGAGFWARTLAPWVWDGPTQHQDLAATLLALHGYPVPAGSSPLGTASPDRVRRLFAYSTSDYGAPQLGVVRGDRALLYAWDGVRSFHHTDVDPAEREDRYADDPFGAARAWRDLDPFIAAVQQTWPHLSAPSL